MLVSSGAIAAGLAPLGLPRRPRDLATQQAAASVGQGLLVHSYTESFARHGRTVGQVLLTADDVTRRAHYRNADRTFERLLDLGVVPVVNENDTVATDEIRFGDNDRLAALVAHLVHADLLVLLSDVDGLYDGDPRKPGPDASITEVRGPTWPGVDDRQRQGGVGTGGMVTKVEAADRHGGRHPGGPDLGAPGRPARWPASRSVRSSTGCASARPPGCSGSRTPRRRAAGCTSTTAPYARSWGGGPRCCRPGSPRSTGDSRPATRSSWSDPTGAAVARGLVAYDAAELPALLGRSTRELGLREVVHRDDLVLVPSW